MVAGSNPAPRTKHKHMNPNNYIILERYLLPDRCVTDFEFECLLKDGTPVTIVDVHYGDNKFCWLRGAQGAPTKIKDLRIRVNQISELVILKKIHKMSEHGQQPFRTYYKQLATARRLSNVQ